MKNCNCLRSFPLTLFLTIFASSLFVQAQQGTLNPPKQEKIPFDTPAIEYENKTYDLGYFVLYERSNFSQLDTNDPQEYAEAIQSMIHNFLFEHKIVEEAKENGYFETHEFDLHNTNLESDWLSRFYTYHQFFKKFEADEDELKERYEAQKENFYQPLRFHFRHIFFRTIDMPEPVQERAKERAEIAIDRIQSGSDFVEVAEEFSDSEKKGELLGPFYTREHDPDQAINEKLEDTLLSMEPGEVSDIIPTQYGYEILKLEKLQPETYRPLEKVKPTLIQKLREEKQKEWTKQIIEEHWDEAVKEYNPDVLFEENPDDDSVVVQIYDRTFTYDDIQQIKGSRVRKTQNMSDEQWKEMMLDHLRNEIIFRFISAKLAKDLNYDQIPAYQVYTDLQRTAKVHNVWWTRKREKYLQENPVTEEEKQAYYENNPRQFYKPVEARLAEMTFKIPEHDEENKYEIYKATNQAQEKALKVLARLENGEEFEKVAKEMSESSRADDGGEIGVVSARSDALPSQVIRMAMNLTEGEYTDEPLKAKGAFYLVKCIEKLPREVRDYDDPAIQERIENTVKNRKEKEYTTKIQNELVDPEKIKVVYEDLFSFNPQNLKELSIDPPK